MAKPDYEKIKTTMNVLADDGTLRPLADVSEIWPGLFQGVRPRSYIGYDLVVNCERYSTKSPLVGYTGTFVHFPLKDDDEQRIDDRAIKRLALFTHGHLHNGGKVLVHCTGGLNRSSLITCEVLKLYGYTPREAVTLLRAKRDNWCLCNKAFERWVLEEQLPTAETSMFRIKEDEE